jgi:hypothetical protein
MSMALFLRAVTPAEAEVMLKDASTLDEIAEREGDGVLATDLQDSYRQAAALGLAIVYCAA